MRISPDWDTFMRHLNRRFVSGEIGHPHLEKQVAVVAASMRIAPGCDAFMRNFNRNFRPHIAEQSDLFDEIQAQESKEAAN